jgi:5-methylcytosine-specific restriction protein A
MIRESLSSFFNNWQIDKDKSTEILSENRKYNSELKLGKIPGKNYPEDKKTYSLYSLNSASIISKKLPALFHNKAGIPKSKYKIQGSIGQGNPAEIPWICVFDLDITKSAQDGFYIVYLFTSDMSGVYLSLNQGWTQYEREYGTKEGRIEIKNNATISKNLLKSDQGFSYSQIDLKATKSLGKGYELGNICSVYYDSNKIPAEEDLINDLRNLIGVYRELKGLVGSDIIDIKGQLDEDSFQVEIQKGKRKVLLSGAIQKKEKKQSSYSATWARDSNMAFTALDNAKFQCENDSNHETFISARTGKQFVEAHHLIPMEYQGNFSVSIDVPENIVSLCPNCHRAFHNSELSIKEELISKFYAIRKSSLKEREINVSKEEILQYYITKPNNL